MFSLPVSLGEKVDGAELWGDGVWMHTEGQILRSPEKGSGIVCGCVVHQTLLSWAEQVFKGLRADFMSPWSLELT